MKRKALIACLAALLSISLSSGPVRAADGPALSDLPPRVQQTIKAELGAGKIDQIDQTTADGKTFYEIDFTKSTTARSLTVDAQGNLIRVQVPLNETPATVQKVISTELGKNKLGDIDRTTEEGETLYLVDLIAPNGDSRSLTVSDDAKWYSLELPLSGAPGPVQKAIRTHLGKNGKLEDLSRVHDEGDLYFEAEITLGTREITLTIGPRGRVLSEEEEVTLKDVPAAVQKTINSNLTGARISSITKVTEGREITFEVEATKNGKDLNFAVAGNGEFLGLDE
jgi:uncharacterized membrane protein YkoI